MLAERNIARLEVFLASRVRGESITWNALFAKWIDFKRMRMKNETNSIESTANMSRK